MLGDCIRLVLKPGNEKFSILYECAFELEQHLQVYKCFIVFYFIAMFAYIAMPGWTPVGWF